jgi:hypothetical protein
MMTQFAARAVIASYGKEAAMKKPGSLRSLSVAFFVVLGALGAFLVGKHVGSAIDREGRSVSVAHDHMPTAPSPPPVAQK